MNVVDPVNGDPTEYCFVTALDNVVERGCVWVTSRCLPAFAAFLRRRWFVIVTTALVLFLWAHVCAMHDGDGWFYAPPSKGGGKPLRMCFGLPGFAFLAVRSLAVVVALTVGIGFSRGAPPPSVDRHDAVAGDHCVPDGEGADKKTDMPQSITMSVV